MSHDQPEKSKKPIVRIILFLILLLLLFIAIFFLRNCASADPKGNENSSASSDDRKLGPSVPIAKLLDPVPEGAGPFATRVSGSGPAYYIRTDPQSGKQTLNDESGSVIYEVGDSKKRGWIAGFTDSRVLIYYTDPGTTLSHPKECWDTRQHFSVSPTSTQFGIGPIFHNEGTTTAIIESMD